jgi:hypothetical protein
MNVERLHLVLRAALEAITKADVFADISGLASSLHNQVNDPATAAYQQQVSSHLEKLRASLAAIETNNFPPGWKQVLTEHKLTYFIGTELLKHLLEIFSRNAITPTIALKDIQEVQLELTQDVTAATELVNGFKRLEFPTDDLNPGEAEVGLLVPRESISSKLDRFTKELNDTAKIIGVFEELTTGQRREPTIRTLSSTDLTVLLDIWPISGVALAAAIERIASFYKQVLEIKKLKAEITRLALPEKMTQQLDQEANEKMEANLRLLRDEVTQDYKGEKTRKHELENEILKRYIASQIKSTKAFILNFARASPRLQAMRTKLRNKRRLDRRRYSSMKWAVGWLLSNTSRVEFSNSLSAKMAVTAVG